jgi:hypothetical protein
MKKIDLDWMKKIDLVFQNKERSVATYRKDGRCNKSVLIDRYFKFLSGKFFILKINEEVYYAMFNRITHTIVSDKDKPQHFSYGVSFALGWSSHEFNISFRDEKLKSQDFKLHWNDIMRIEYEEITNEEYWDVVKLFLKTAHQESCVGKK